MTNTVFYLPLFVKRAKQLQKKHPSLKQDLEKLEASLLLNPKQGVDLGGGLFKIRLTIKSKNKGKSGGYRVITYLIKSAFENTTVNMITLFDKSEESSISKSYLLDEIKAVFD